MNSEVAKTVLYYITKSERIICLKIKAKRHNIVIIQLYAPNESAEEAEKFSSTRSYEKQLRNIRSQRIK